MDSQFLYSPKYFDMLVSSTGQLSGEKRYRRVIEIGRKNIWLAAKCKNTCVKEEPELVNWIILRCSALYRKFGDIQSLVALFELREYGIIGYLLNLMNSSGMIIKPISELVKNKNVRFSEAFARVIEHLDVSLSMRLFYRFIELGYVFDINTYNVLLSKVKTQEEAQALTNMMSSTGVDADALTYCYLLRKDRDYKSALTHFKSFKNTVDFDKQKLVITAYRAMLIRCTDYNQLSEIYNDFRSIYSDYASVMKLNSTFYGHAILLSKDELEARYYFDLYKNIVMEQIKENPEGQFDKLSRVKREKNHISYLSKFYVQKISTLSLPFELFLSYLESIINLIVYEIQCGIPFKEYGLLISQKMNKENSFSKGKQMMQLMIKYNQRVSPVCYESLLLLAKSEKEIDFVLDKYDCSTIDPQKIVAYIKHIAPPTAIHLFGRLKEKQYPINIFIYNTIIKLASFHHSLSLIEQMQAEGITPDIQTIQPLLRKWNSIDDLSYVLLLATKLKVESDGRASYAIVRRATELKLESDLIDFSYEDSRMQNNTFSSTWKQTVIKASNALIWQ